MSEEQLIDFFTKNYDYFVTNDFVVSILRKIGWMIVKFFCQLIDYCKQIYDAAFGIIDITKYTGLENFISEYNVLIQVLIALSLVALGYMFIFGKEKKHDLLASFIIFAVVFTSSSYLFSTMNSFAVLFKDGVTQESGEADGYTLVNQNLYDLKYIDESIGLANMTGDEPPHYDSLSKADMRMINIGETLPDDEDGLSDGAKDILGKYMVYSHSGSVLKDVYDGALWTDVGNTFYFRYSFQYGTFYLNALALIIVYFGLAYVNVKVIVELLRSRVLVTLFSTDFSSKKKVVKILESIRDEYYALCFTAIELRVYLLATDFMNTRTELSGFVKSVLLLFIAFTMIEGSSITEKITGVDAGVSATTHRMMGAAHAVRGAAQFGMQVKQMSMLKNNTEAMKQMQGGNGMSDENSNDGTGGMPGNDNGQGASGKPNQSDPDHNSSNINNKEDIDNQETNGMQMNETSATQGDTNMQNSVEEKNTDSAITATEDAENGTDQNFAQMDQAIGDADNNNTGWDKGENKAVEAGEGTMFERWEAKQSDAENMRESMQNLDDIGKTSADLPKKNADRSRPRNINNGTSYNDTPSREKEHPTKFSTETIGNTTYVGGDGGSEKGMFGRVSKRYTDYTNGKEKK